MHCTKLYIVAAAAATTAVYINICGIPLNRVCLPQSYFYFFQSSKFKGVQACVVCVLNGLFGIRCVAREQEIELEEEGNERKKKLKKKNK